MGNNVMAGCDMAQRIRNSGTYRTNINTPIIAVTSRYDSESLKRYLSGGITGYLKKPATKDSIYSIIMEKVIQNHSKVIVDTMHIK
jgi:CheY-like chemotaxis protein